MSSNAEFLYQWIDWLYELKERADRQWIENMTVTTAEKYIRLDLPFLKHPIELRIGTTDMRTFQSIFLSGVCNVASRSTFQPEFIIDGGANIGISSVFFSNLYPESQIIAIEPEASNFEQLSRNVANYGNIKAIQAGLWGSSSRLELIRKGSGKDFFRTRPSTGAHESILGITVPEVLLLANQPRVGLLKLDVEGAELDIFSKDPGQWIAKVDSMLIEVHDQFAPGASQAVFRALYAADYSRYLLGDNEFILFHNTDVA